MSTLTLNRPRPFKDYCLTMQVHPEADAGVVDAAYWYLAKCYSAKVAGDPSARAKLDELNEAYSVLGSPDRREAYMKLRATTLGEGALPLLAQAAPGPRPLTVMDRQRPVPREPATATGSLGRFALPQLQCMLAICATLIAAMAALLAGAPSGAVVAVLALVLPLSALPLWRPSPAPAPPPSDNAAGN